MFNFVELYGINVCGTESEFIILLYFSTPILHKRSLHTFNFVGLCSRNRYKKPLVFSVTFI